MKIKKGDKVKVLSGKNKGKTGSVTETIPATGKVVVDGVNMLTKHQRPKKEGEKGTTVKFAAPMPAAKLMLICPKCGKTTRVAYSVPAEGKKVRQCKKCQGTF
jgi:large subunit ribosomal protein L24